MAKALYLSSQNTVDCYKSFCSVSKFLITNTTFFFSLWNICSIISLISITYLVLVHNYDTIKCICFISPRQRAGMSSRCNLMQETIKVFMCLSCFRWTINLVWFCSIYYMISSFKKKKWSLSNFIYDQVSQTKK